METKKEERTEYVGISVTPTIKKEFELAKDNQALKETILKRFLANETEWLSDELKEIDDATIKYSAKLIGIKEAFGKCQDAYSDEIAIMYNKAYKSFQKIKDISDSTNESIKTTKEKLSFMLEQISNINFYKIEKTLELINKVNSMSESELELMKKLLNS